MLLSCVHIVSNYKYLLVLINPILNNSFRIIFGFNLLTLIRITQNFEWSNCINHMSIRVNSCYRVVFILCQTISTCQH